MASKNMRVGIELFSKFDGSGFRRAQQSIDKITSNVRRAQGGASLSAGGVGGVGGRGGGVQRVQIEGNKTVSPGERAALRLQKEQVAVAKRTEGLLREQLRDQVSRGGVVGGGVVRQAVAGPAGPTGLRTHPMVQHASQQIKAPVGRSKLQEVETAMNKAEKELKRAHKRVLEERERIATIEKRIETNTAFLAAPPTRGLAVGGSSYAQKGDTKGNRARAGRARKSQTTTARRIAQLKSDEEAIQRYQENLKRLEDEHFSAQVKFGDLSEAHKKELDRSKSPERLASEKALATYSEALKKEVRPGQTVSREIKMAQRWPSMPSEVGKAMAASARGRGAVRAAPVIVEDKGVVDQPRYKGLWKRPPGVPKTAAERDEEVREQVREAVKGAKEGAEEFEKEERSRRAKQRAQVAEREKLAERQRAAKVEKEELEKRYAERLKDLSSFQRAYFDASPGIGKWLKGQRKLPGAELAITKGTRAEGVTDAGVVRLKTQVDTAYNKLLRTIRDLERNIDKLPEEMQDGIRKSAQTLTASITRSQIDARKAAEQRDPTSRAITRASYISDKVAFEQAIERQLRDPMRDAGVSMGRGRGRGRGVSPEREAEQREWRRAKRAEQIASISGRTRDFERRVRAAGLGEQAEGELLRRVGGLRTQYGRRFREAGRAQLKAADTIRFDTQFKNLSRSFRQYVKDAKGAIRESSELGRMLRNMESASVLAIGPLSGLGARIRSFGAITARGSLAVAAYAGTFVGLGAAMFTVAKRAITAGLEFERIEGALTVLTRNTYLTQKLFEDLSVTAVKFGVNIETSTFQFAKLAAASKGTSLGMKSLKDVYEGVSAAIATFKIDSQSQEKIFRALTQMMSKGTAQAEEVRNQFAEHLPGAARLMAEGMGMSMQKFNKALKLGRVASEDLIKVIGEVFTKNYTTSGLAAAGTMRSQLNIMTTQWFEFGLAIDKATGLSDRARTVLQNINKTLEEGKNDAKTWVDHMVTAGAVLGGLGGLGAAKFGRAIVRHQSQARSLTREAVGNFSGSTRSVGAFAKAFASLPLVIMRSLGPLGLLTAGIVALGVAAGQALTRKYTTPVKGRTVLEDTNRLLAEVDLIDFKAAGPMAHERKLFSFKEMQDFRKALTDDMDALYELKTLASDAKLFVKTGDTTRNARNFAIDPRDPQASALAGAAAMQAAANEQQKAGSPALKALRRGLASFGYEGSMEDQGGIIRHLEKLVTKHAYSLEVVTQRLSNAIAESADRIHTLSPPLAKLEESLIRLDLRLQDASSTLDVFNSVKEQLRGTHGMQGVLPAQQAALFSQVSRNVQTFAEVQTIDELHKMFDNMRQQDTEMAKAVAAQLSPEDPQRMLEIFDYNKFRGELVKAVRAARGLEGPEAVRVVKELAVAAITLRELAKAPRPGGEARARRADQAELYRMLGGFGTDAHSDLMWDIMREGSPYSTNITKVFEELEAPMKRLLPMIEKYVAENFKPGTETTKQLIYFTDMLSSMLKAGRDRKLGKLSKEHFRYSNRQADILGDLGPLGDPIRGDYRREREDAYRSLFEERKKFHEERIATELYYSVDWRQVNKDLTAAEVNAIKERNNKIAAARAEGAAQDDVEGQKRVDDAKLRRSRSKFLREFHQEQASMLRLGAASARGGTGSPEVARIQAQMTQRDTMEQFRTRLEGTRKFIDEGDERTVMAKFVSDYNKAQEHAAQTLVTDLRKAHTDLKREILDSRISLYSSPQLQALRRHEQRLEEIKVGLGAISLSAAESARYQATLVGISQQMYEAEKAQITREKEFARSKFLEEFRREQADILKIAGAQAKYPQGTALATVEGRQATEEFGRQTRAMLEGQAESITHAERGRLYDEAMRTDYARRRGEADAQVGSALMGLKATLDRVDAFESHNVYRSVEQDHKQRYKEIADGIASLDLNTEHSREYLARLTNISEEQLRLEKVLIRSETLRAEMPRANVPSGQLAADLAQTSVIQAFFSSEARQAINDSFVNFIEGTIFDMNRAILEATLTNPLKGVINGFIDSIVQDFATGITQKEYRGFGTFLGNTASGFFKDLFGRGGSPADVPIRDVDVSSALVKRHKGGIVGKDESLSLLKKGEGVFTPAQMKALGRGSGFGGGGVTVNIIGAPSTPTVVQQEAGDGGVDIQIEFDQMMAENVARSGNFQEALLALTGTSRPVLTR